LFFISNINKFYQYQEFHEMQSREVRIGSFVEGGGRAKGQIEEGRRRKKKKREELLHQRRDEEMIQALLGKFSVNDESSDIASEVCDDNELDDSFFS
jgi:hypothetical protein